MRHGSLFSGIGGFDLAAKWMGWENVFHCEIDKYCQRVLKKRFKNTALHEDIRTTDFSIYKGRIDILTGGDPCQPHSVAGLGKGEADERFLWPEMFRAFRQSQPAWGVNENVVGSVANGVLDRKIDDLESIGYTCQAYNISAESVGALHQRERIWLVAYNADVDRNNKASRKIQRPKEGEGLEKERHKIHESWEPVDLRVFNPDADIERLKELDNAKESETFTERLSRYFGFGAAPHGNITRNAIESGIVGMLNGLPEGMDYANRNQRIKTAGNAIVPELVYEIFKAIEEFEKHDN